VGGITKESRIDGEFKPQINDTAERAEEVEGGSFYAKWGIEIWDHSDGG